FSSRRRHTRFSRDWSSDVCSSDLKSNPALAGEVERLDALSKQLDQVETLEKALAGGSAPAAGYTALAREALAMGRLDLAERALADRKSGVQGETGGRGGGGGGVKG